MSSQSNALLSKLNDKIPQASLLPLLISLVVTLAVPPDKVTVAFLQMAVGGTVSNTVTVAVSVSSFPFTSTTVKVTVFVVPTLLQSKSYSSK